MASVFTQIDILKTKINKLTKTIDTLEKLREMDKEKLEETISKMKYFKNKANHLKVKLNKARGYKNGMD